MHSLAPRPFMVFLLAVLALASLTFVLIGMPAKNHAAPTAQKVEPTALRFTATPVEQSVFSVPTELLVELIQLGSEEQEDQQENPQLATPDAVRLSIPVDDELVEFDIKLNELVPPNGSVSYTDDSGQHQVNPNQRNLLGYHFIGVSNSHQFSDGSQAYIALSILPQQPDAAFALEETATVFQIAGVLGVSNKKFSILGRENFSNAINLVAEASPQVELELSDVMRFDGELGAPRCPGAIPNEGNTYSPIPLASAADGGYGQRSVLYSVAEAAQDANFELVNNLGGPIATFGFMQQAFNGVDAFWRSQLRIRLRVIYQHAWNVAADPYDGGPTNSGREYLAQGQASFESRGIATGTNFDLAQVFIANPPGSGGFDGGPVIGMSIMGACQFQPSIILNYGAGNMPSLCGHELSHDMRLQHIDSPINIMTSIFGNRANYVPEHVSQLAPYANGERCFQIVTNESAPPGPVNLQEIDLDAYIPGSIYSPSAGNQIPLKWSLPNGGGILESYQVFRSDTPVGCNAAPMGSVVSEYFVDTLSERRLWYYSVRAVNRFGAGPCSQVVSVPVPSDVTIESNKLATTLPNQPRPPSVLLSGRAGSGVVNFYIWKGVGGPSGSFSPAGEAAEIHSQAGMRRASYTDNSAPSNGASVWYLGYVCNVSGCAQSATVDSFLLTIPLAPTSLTSIPASGTNSIKLSVTSASHPNLEERFVAENFNASVGQWLNVSGTSTTALGQNRFQVEVPGVNTSEDRRYRVVAQNDVGTSSPSSEIVSYAFVPSAGVAASGVSSPGYRDFIRVTWQSVRGANGYILERAPELPAEAPFVWVGQTGMNITGLTFDDSSVAAGGARFRYRVRAYNDYAQAVSVPVLGMKDATPLITTQPSNVRVASGSPASFSVVANAGGAALSYRWFRNGTEISGATASTYSLSSTANADNGAQFYVIVTAAGSYSTTSASATLRVDGRVNDLIASDGTETSSVRLTWSSVLSGGTYEVFRSTTNQSCVGQSIGTTNGTTYFDQVAVGDNLPGVTYFYSVRLAFSDATFGPCSAADSGYAQIDAPGLSVAQNGLALRSTITKPLGAIWYQLFRSTTAAPVCDGNPYAIFDDVPSYDDLSIVPGQLYHYGLRAVGSNQSFGRCRNATGQFNLSTPSGFSASQRVHADKIRLTWSAVPLATSYEILRANTAVGCAAAGEPIADVTQITWDNVGLPQGANYYYYVRAKHTGGARSACSSAQGSTDVVPVITSQPQDIFISNTSTINIGVTASAPVAITYRWYKNDTLIPGATGASYSATLTSADNGARFFCRLSTGGSNFVDTRAALVTFMQPVTSVAASDGTSSSAIDVSWSNSVGASGYVVYRSTSASPACSGQPIASPASNSYSDTNVSLGQQYYYSVKASYGGANFSPCSATDVGFLGAGQSTGLSTPLTASQGTSASSVDLSWGISSNAAVTNVRVFRNSDCSGNPITTTGVTNLYADSTTVPGTNYPYTIQVRFSNGQLGACSNPASGYRALGTVVGSATANRPGDVRLSWGAVSGATQYRVFRSGSSASGCSGAPITVSTTSPFTDTSAPTGVDLFYAVQAQSAAYTGPCSAPISGVALVVAPTNVVASQSEFLDRIDLRWQATSGAVGYKVYADTAQRGCFVSPVDNAATSWSFPVTQGQLRYFSVRGVGANGSLGACSEIISGASDLLPSITQQPVSRDVLLGASASFSTAASSSRAIVYRWFRNNVEVGNTASYLIPTTARSDDAAEIFARLSTGGLSYVETNRVSLAVLSPPFDITSFVDLTSPSVDIRWQKQARVVRVNLYRSATASACSGTPITQDLTTLSTNDFGVARGATYYYSLKGFTADQRTTNCSDVVAVAIVAPTPTPTATPTHTATRAPTQTPTNTPTHTPTQLATVVPTVAPTATPTATLVPGTSPSGTPTPIPTGSGPVIPPGVTPTVGGSPTANPGDGSDGGIAQEQRALFEAAKCRLISPRKKSLTIELIDARKRLQGVRTLGIKSISCSLVSKGVKASKFSLSTATPRKTLRNLRSKRRYTATLTMRGVNGARFVKKCSAATVK
jgi:hypothetical protein